MAPSERLNVATKDEASVAGSTSMLIVCNVSLKTAGPVCFSKLNVKISVSVFGTVTVHSFIVPSSAVMLYTTGSVKSLGVSVLV